MTESIRSAAPPASGTCGATEVFPVGAHLVTPRLGYEHHGIYVGANRVVHYAGLSRALLRGPVEEVSLAEFADGRKIAVRRRRRVRFAPQEVVARARSRLGEDLYRLMSNNCEHFCEWCQTGESRSEQIDALLAWLGAPILFAGRLIKSALAVSISA